MSLTNRAAGIIDLTNDSDNDSDVVVLEERTRPNSDQSPSGQRATAHASLSRSLPLDQQHLPVNTFKNGQSPVMAPRDGYSATGSIGATTNHYSGHPDYVPIHSGARDNANMSLEQAAEKRRRVTGPSMEPLASERIHRGLGVRPTGQGLISDLIPDSETIARAGQVIFGRYGPIFPGLSANLRVASPASLNPYNITKTSVDSSKASFRDNSIAFSKEDTKQRRLISTGSAHASPSKDGEDGDVDSVLSHLSITSGSEEPQISAHASTLNRPFVNVAPVLTQDDSSRRRQANQFSEEEDHFLIFLKEVKKYRWKDIDKAFPHRKYATLQTRYSSMLNRRDRSKDPPILKLPDRFASEARIDWATVHAECPRPDLKGEGAISSLSRPTDLDDYFLPESADTDEELQHDLPSEAEFDSRPKRSRRAVPKVDYRLKLSLTAALVEDEDEGAMDFTSTRHVDSLARSEEPSEESYEESTFIPEKAIPVENEPLKIDFDAKDAELALAAWKQSPDISNDQLPYLSYRQLSDIRKPHSSWEWDQLISRIWQGSILHVDFGPGEIAIVERLAMKSLGLSEYPNYSSRRRRLQTSLTEISQPRLLKLAHQIGRRLLSRSQESIKAFLQDAQTGKLSSKQRIGRIGAARPNKTYSSEAKMSPSSFLRNRELGSQSNRGWRASSKPLTYQLKNSVWDTLGPAYRWTGASSDIHTLAWSPDGQCFAAGAVAVSDPHSMQYNKPNNLLYGNTVNRSIHELGEHSDDRPPPEEVQTGPNSTHAMYASQDSQLYKTVSSVAFSPSGRLLYSAGYDKHVCIWSISDKEPQPELATAMRAKAELDMLTVSCDGLLAIAVKRSSNNSVKVISVDEDTPSEYTWSNFHSQKAGQRPDQNILPTALKFDPSNGRALLAGFGANVRNDRLETTGDICLWDVGEQKEALIHGANKNVFDLTFNPNQRHMPWFAVGCVAGHNVNRGTRSLIRLYNGYGDSKFSMQMELECKALDMNDVVWCPYDEHLIAAGCTSGRAYVWDLRRPDHFLRELGHGRSLMPLEDGIDREITDTGIRFLSWGENSTRLYSGSSDGVVKVWDVTRSEEQTFIKDLITVDSGIMSGAFSPDKSRLVIGEVNGSVDVLEIGRNDDSIKDAEVLKYFSYDEETRNQMETSHPEITADSGIAEANRLLDANQITLAPMGVLPVWEALQGEEYSGPFDQGVDAPALRQQALEFQLALAKSPESQCPVASCKDSFVKITSEEKGDSGRSQDRIPDELRRQWTETRSEFPILQGKSRCTSCGRPARPLPFTADVVTTPILCERCSFACFRCGAINKIEPAHVLLACRSCERIWDMGSLGYDCIKQTGRAVNSLDVPLLKGYGEDCHISQAQDENDTSYGDEMNALTDYYHSLAIDRPESPPL